MKNFIFIILLLNCLNLFAQNSIVNNYSVVGNNIEFHDIQSDQNCGTYISGLNKTDNKVFVLHLDNNNDTIWAKSYDFTGYSANISEFKLSVSDSAIYFLAGKFDILPSTTTPYYIIGKLNTTGNLLWAKATKSSFYIFSDILCDQNKVYCAFSSRDDDSLKVFKFDSNGNHLWKTAISYPFGFNLPTVNKLIINYGWLQIFGRVTAYANFVNNGSYALWVNSGDGETPQILRFFSNSNNIKAAHINSIRVNHQLYLCGQATLSTISLSKFDLGINNSIVKNYYSPNENIQAKSIYLRNNNSIIITGIISNTNAKTKGLIIELDTNLNLISSYKYDDPNNLLNVNFNKSISNCGINKTIGIISNTNFSNGYLLSKDIINDTVCNQENILILDSLINDTNILYTPAQQITSAWINISHSQSPLNISKYDCLTIDAIQVNHIDDELKIYPNPSKIGHLVIESQEMINNIEVINAIGETILIENNLNDKTHWLPVNSFKNGIYMIKVGSKNGMSVKKIIIEN